MAILAALGLLDAQRHARAVGVGCLQRDDLAGTKAGTVGQRQRCLVLEVAAGIDQARDLGSIQRAVWKRNRAAVSVA